MNKIFKLPFWKKLKCKNFLRNLRESHHHNLHWKIWITVIIARSNTVIFRSESTTEAHNPGKIRDCDYYEKRRRNNEAARKSREKRRLNDMEMERQLKILKEENEKLKNRLLVFFFKIFGPKF